MKLPRKLSKNSTIAIQICMTYVLYPLLQYMVHSWWIINTLNVPEGWKSLCHSWRVSQIKLTRNCKCLLPQSLQVYFLKLFKLCFICHSVGHYPHPPAHPIFNPTSRAKDCICSFKQSFLEQKSLGIARNWSMHFMIDFMKNRVINTMLCNISRPTKQKLFCSANCELNSPLNRSSENFKLVMFGTIDQFIERHFCSCCVEQTFMK